MEGMSAIVAKMVAHLMAGIVIVLLLGGLWLLLGTPKGPWGTTICAIYLLGGWIWSLLEAERENLAYQRDRRVRQSERTLIAPNYMGVMIIGTFAWLLIVLADQLTDRVFMKIIRKKSDRRVRV